jgi:FimV-like protein
MIDFSFINSLGLSKTNIILLCDAVIIVFTVFLIYMRKVKQQKLLSETIQNKNNPSIVITSKDIRAIAGDDVMVTQLDLARAYLELGKKKLAKQILDHVIKHGNPSQQQSARQLMASF